MKELALAAEVDKEKKWDPEVGAKISYNPEILHKMITCTTEVNGIHYRSNYIFRPLSEFCCVGEICREIASFGSGLSHVTPFEQIFI